MAQEIITYLIIAAAILIAVQKIYRTLSGKKRKSRINFSKEKFTMVHNCSDCAADCTLRDAIPQVKQENADICETNIKPIDS